MAAYDHGNRPWTTYRWECLVCLDFSFRLLWNLLGNYIFLNEALIIVCVYPHLQNIVQVWRLLPINVLGLHVWRGRHRVFHRLLGYLITTDHAWFFCLNLVQRCLLWTQAHLHFLNGHMASIDVPYAVSFKQFVGASAIQNLEFVDIRMIDTCFVVWWLLRVILYEIIPLFFVVDVFFCSL